MNDQQIRQAVLEAVNNQRKKSSHEHNMRMQVSQIEHGVKKLGYRCTDNQIMQAVDYLTQTGMLKRKQETKMVKMPTPRYSRTTPNSFKHVNYWYTLSAKAIDKLEGETEFSAKPFVPLQNIHINTSNAPVIVGSNNLVNNNVALFNQLDDLQQAISDNVEIDVEERQDAASDIESIKQQLAKPNPNKSVVELLWRNIGRVADIAGAGALAVQVAKTIAAIIGHPIG